ncbi:senecionine N-oxygenase-like isoform X2 [Argopecten irradians]|uniref:senecionine N-oxygenase-like isoform X2 n=1 Tax=Argopecten irradians TaxID=31199 RepID=UPI003717ACA8
MPVFSIMYRDLIGNFPRQLMEFPGFPNTEPEKSSSYLHREEVFNYIKRFCKHYDLEKYIQTHTYVTDISPKTNERCPEWTVSYRDVRDKEIKQADFDAVFVCTGHQHTPYIPDIDGVEEFQGEIIHSKNYRIPEKFADKRIVILGAAFSGTDLTFAIAPHAQQIFLSHIKDRLESVLPENVTQKPGIKRMTQKTVVFLDDTEAEVDVLLLCTGYRYSFPFLSDDVITATRDKVTPLYKHVVNVKYSNLFFVGILEFVHYFGMGHMMSKYAVRVLDGDAILPSETEMLKDIDNDFELRKQRGDKPHLFSMNEQIWQLDKEFAKLAGVAPSPDAFEKLSDFVYNHGIKNNLGNYREKKFKFSEDRKSFKIVN